MSTPFETMAGVFCPQPCPCESQSRFQPQGGPTTPPSGFSMTLAASPDAPSAPSAAGLSWQPAASISRVAQSAADDLVRVVMVISNYRSAVSGAAYAPRMPSAAARASGVAAGQLML